MLGISPDEVLVQLSEDKAVFEEVVQPSLVHYDMWDGNLFVKEKHISGIIDWERAMWGEAFMDDRFRRHTRNNDFLRGFGKEVFTKDEMKRIYWYDVLLYLTMMTEGSYRGYEDDSQYRWAKEMFEAAWKEIETSATDGKNGGFGAVGRMPDVDENSPVCYMDSDHVFIAAILNKIAGEYQEILKDKLTGIYVHGSIAFGCFNWEESDIDFVVVVKDMLSPEEKEKLIMVLLDWDKAAPHGGFEMSIVLERYCNPFIYPTPFELHFSNRHKERCKQDLKKYCEGMHGLDKDLAAHFTVIRKVGKVLCGKNIPDVFGKVPREDYLDSIKCDVSDAVNEITKEPVYMILNLCRILAFTEENAVISKKQGGEWGMRNLPKIRVPVVRKALQSYCGSGIFREEEKQLKSFAEYMTKRINGDVLD